MSAWVEHTDDVTGLTLLVPVDLTTEEHVVNLPAKGNIPAVEQRNTSFLRSNEVGVLGIGFVPNPTGLSVVEWVDAYPGAPGEATKVAISGEQGIRFDTNVLDEPAALVYFGHDGFIFIVSGNVFGNPGAGQPPALTEDDFDYIIESLEFSK